MYLDVTAFEGQVGSNEPGILLHIFGRCVTIQKATLCSGRLKWDKRPLWDTCSSYVRAWTARVLHQAPEQWEHRTAISPQTGNLPILHRADSQLFNEISICWNSVQTDSVQRALASSLTRLFLALHNLNRPKAFDITTTESGWTGFCEFERGGAVKPTFWHLKVTHF